MPLSPYRVLDLTEGGFNWCGRVLADFGADVIKIEPPAGSPDRAVGPFYQDATGGRSSLFWEAYCANKRGVTLDIETGEGQQVLRELASGAHIVIESFAPGHLAERGLGYQDLSRLNPGLVMTSITPFGQTGPYSAYQATDLVAWSMGGMQYICGDADRPPLRIGYPQAQLSAGGQAAAGTMTALWHRLRTGQGQHVDVSMQVAVIWTLMNATPFPPLHGVNSQRAGAFAITRGMRNRQVYSCKDGFVTMLSSPKSLASLTAWMIEEGGAPAWLGDIDWDSWDLSRAIAEDDTEFLKTFTDLQGLAEGFLLGKTKTQLYDRAISHRILLAPCQTVKDIAESPQLAARDFWTDLDSPENNGMLRYLGPYIKMGESPLKIRRPAPRIGAHNGEILGELASRSDKTGDTANPDSDVENHEMPFEGLRVLDFTWVGVGPITIKYLADHGAEVIRVESVSRPDVLRNAPPFKDARPGINRSQFPASYNTGKYGLGLNMSEPGARELVWRLIREWRPDVIAESFTPRVMPSWGLGYQDVRAALPDIVYFSTCQQGQTGPHSSFAGFGQLAASLAGFYHLTGWPDRDPVVPYGAYADFINPPNAFAAIVAALEYRRRTGKGQHLDLAQYECATQYLAPAIMDYMASGRILNRRGNADENAIPHGVYRCKDSVRRYTGLGESWLAITVSSEDQWRSLCGVIGRASLPGDPRFRGAEERRRNIDALDRVIEEWTRDQDARAAMEGLQRAGVPAGVVQSQADLWEDPQLAHRGFFTWLDHAECGPMPYDGLQFLLSKTPGLLRPQALIGQHNAAILKEKLGLTEGEIGDLVAEGVLEAS
jgi:crotonobetainyl-CoA:carnitine CoA-transferase CaiB-like acyl-CoA transferase